MNSYGQQGSAAAALHNLNNNMEEQHQLRHIKKAACKLQAAFQNAISKA